MAQLSTASLQTDWERAKAYTLEYLEAMPEDKYAYKPTPEIRSFAQQMLHLADANYGLVATALEQESPYGFGDVEKTEDPTKENVIKVVMASYDYVLAGIQTLETIEGGEMIQLFQRFDVTREDVFRKAFEHQTHHRGQSTIYLRMAGVTPPNEKLF